MKNLLLILSVLCGANFASFAQSITSVYPSSGNQGTMNLPVNIIGSSTNFSNATNTLLRFSQGTSTLNAPQVESANAVSGTTVDALVSIPYNTPIGFYNVEVYDATLNGFVALPNGFEVITASTVPVLKGTAPNKTSPTQLLPVTMFVENAHFSQATDNSMYLFQGSNSLMPISGTIQALNDHYIQAEFDISQLNPAIGSYLTSACGNSFDGAFFDTDAILVTESTSISGLINYAGSVYQGQVDLYQKITDTPPHYSKVASVEVDPVQFTYAFTDIAEAEYLVRAVPVNTSAVLATYYPSTVQWQNATDVQSTTQGATGIDITPVVSLNSNGQGSVAGSIGFGPNGFFKASIVYQEGLEVFLKNTSSNTYAQTFTDANGAYNFSYIPFGSYTIEINIPGYTQISSYNISISNGSPSFNELDFLIDENEIFTFASLSVSELSEAIFRVFPNPSSGMFTVRLADSFENLNLSVTNQLGEIVFNRDFNDVSATGDLRLDLSKFAAGLYFLKVKTENKEAHSRLIISKY